VGRCVRRAGAAALPLRQIVLAGQAESLIPLDGAGGPLGPGISWLDMRSTAECVELQERFPRECTYRITGQPSIIPTWPITKMLWLKRNEPERFARTATYLLLKDYVQYRLTGRLAGEFSIYSFSHYFDVTRKAYWREILDACGVRQGQLPRLVEPCTVLGPILPEVAASLGVNAEARVNVGTLDHCAGMIGTGNIAPGAVSESTCTVLSIATLADAPLMRERADLRLPCHYGPYKDTYVLRLGHGTLDVAYAVMEGVAHLLKKNVATFERAGV
jgi:sugar (pentulose or hexulose) kinase